MILLWVIFEGSAEHAVERTVTLAVSYFVSHTAPLHMHKYTDVLSNMAKVPAVVLDCMLDSDQCL